MIKNIITVVAALGLALTASPAFAEEVVEEELVVEEVVVEEAPAPEPEPTPEPEPAPEPEPEYVPPPEAHEGVGGWAVVDPNTGKVHGVIVGSMKTYENRNGVIGHEYMGCSADCVLRFQTKATSDGNVAGYGSSGNTEVKFNNSDSTFSITDNGPDGSRSVSVLVPEKTASDPAGMDLSTGIVSRNITKKNNDVDVEIQEDYVDGEKDNADIKYLTWGADTKLFNYINGRTALTDLETDVDSELLLDFPTIESTVEERESVDEETGETVVEEILVEETVIDEENPVVRVIRSVTESVLNFFNSLFGN